MIETFRPYNRASASGFLAEALLYGLASGSAGGS